MSTAVPPAFAWGKGGEISGNPVCERTAGRVNIKQSSGASLVQGQQEREARLVSAASSAEQTQSGSTLDRLIASLLAADGETGRSRSHLLKPNKLVLSFCWAVGDCSRPSTHISNNALKALSM